MTGTILEKIVETKRREVAEAKRTRSPEAVRAAAANAPPPRDFYGAVTAGGRGIRLIGEIKKASPSAGLIRADFDPAGLARTYADAGAAALSVLTDRTYFGAELCFVEQVKAAVPLPVLRKDFIVDEYQVLETRAAGSDAILLIVALLTPAQLQAWSRNACELGMTTLIEVHAPDEFQLIRELIGPQQRTILGINNRELGTQTIDLAATERIAAGLPRGTPFVSESGIRTRQDVVRMQTAGASALLIGETFMRSPDVGAKVRELFEGV